MPAWTEEGQTLAQVNILLLLLQLVVMTMDVVRHLDVDEQLQEVSWRHDDGGVERDDVALVEAQVQVGGQTLRKEQVLL